MLCLTVQYTVSGLLKTFNLRTFTWRGTTIKYIYISMIRTFHLISDAVYRNKHPIFKTSRSHPYLL